MKTQDGKLREEVLSAWDVAWKNGAIEKLAKGTKIRIEAWRDKWVAGTKGWLECPIYGSECEELEVEGGKRSSRGFKQHFEMSRFLSYIKRRLMKEFRCLLRMITHVNRRYLMRWRVYSDSNSSKVSSNSSLR